jgi:O-antigen/teichoic acid export membrane protein
MLVLGMLTSILLARFLGPTGRGEVAAVLLWPMLLVYLGSLGMIDCILYFAAQPDVAAELVFTNGLALAVLQSIVVIPIGYVLMPMLLASQSPEVVRASRSFLLVIPISLVSQYGISILQAKLKITIFNIARMIIPIGYLTGSILLFLINRLTVKSVANLQLTLNAVVMVVVLSSLLVWGNLRRLQISIPLMKDMLKYGLQVHVGSISSNVNLRLDQVLMAAWITPDQLGYYVVAASVASVSGVLSTAVNMMAVPDIAKHSEPKQRIATFETVFQQFWVANIVIKVLFLFIVPWGIPLIYGAAYTNSIWIAEILVVASLFFDATLVLTGGARAFGVPWLASRVEIITAVITALLLLILLPRLGILGAAITSLIAYATTWGLLLHSLWRKEGVSPAELFRMNKGGARMLKRINELLTTVSPGK